MADVLISYARRDRGIAARLAACLEERGLKAVWDVSELPEGALMHHARERVAQAPAVVVLWSESSAESAWVCDEADAAAARNAHVAALLGVVQNPMPAQTSVDLADWRQTGAAAGLDDLIAAIAATSSTSHPPVPAPGPEDAAPIAPDAPSQAPEESSGGGFGAAIGFILVWLLLIGIAVSRQQERAPIPLPGNLPAIDMDATEPLEVPVIIPTPEEENAQSGLRPNQPVKQEPAQDSTGSVKK
jgi:hypothetical protein